MRRFRARKKGGQETGIQIAILSYLNAIGVLAWRQSNHAVPMLIGGEIVYRKDNFRLRGVGDITGILYDGKRLEVEVKAKGKKQSDDQKYFESLINENSGIYILAYSVDDVENALRAKGYIIKDGRGVVCLNKSTK